MSTFYTKNISRGYSLVELIIAIGLFSVVMLLATTAYMTLIDMDRAARARSELVNNLSFAVESMTRSIRTGTQYRCRDFAEGSYSNSQCMYWSSGPLDCFGFVDQEGRDVTYVKKNDGTIGRYIGTSPGDRSCSSATAVSVTDPNIHIERLDFYPTGMAVEDGGQPTVLIVVQGYIDVKQRGETKRSEFSLQTRATQRQFDI